MGSVFNEYAGSGNNVKLIAEAETCPSLLDSNPSLFCSWTNPLAEILLQVKQFDTQLNERSDCEKKGPAIQNQTQTPTQAGNSLQALLFS